jgi:hypothetical protein
VGVPSADHAVVRKAEKVEFLTVSIEESGAYGCENVAFEVLRVCW